MAPLDLVSYVVRRLVFCLPVISAVAAAAPTGETVANVAADSMRLLDFDELDRPGSPNHWLIAPRGKLVQLQADSPAAVFEVSPEQLVAAWLEVVRGQPRTTIVAVSDDRLQVEAEQRSALFGFVDRISFRVVPLDSGQTSYVAYSRSQTGYWDIGVNKRRLLEWTAALRLATGDGTSR